MKILILALSGIGDALMFTPALTLLRKTYPDAQIDALVMFAGVKDMYERNPALNNVLYFNFLKEDAASSLKYILSLRKKYDASINVYPANRKEYNIINFLIGAKKKAGVKYLRKDNQNLGWLNNFRIAENDSLHNVQENIKLCEKLFNISFNEEPDLNFPLSNEDENFAREYISKLDLKDDELVVGFHPGSATLKNHERRRWEPEKFIALGKKLIEKKNAKILIFGGPEEKELKNKIKDEINSPNVFTVETENLPQSAAVMKRCNVFVSNDSSLMHIASAMKLNVVAIIGPTNPNYIHPWHTNHKIVTLNLECAPCFIYSPRPLICFRTDVKFKCIKEVNVDMVYDAVKNFIT
jgi:lipopolysaccharide heptosyltransferase II